VAIPLQMIRAHIVPDATDAGMSEASAALILTTLGATITAFRIGLGRISDRLGNKYTYLICLVLQLLPMFALVGGRSPWLFYAVAVVFGMGTAGASITYPKIVADIFGVTSMGTIIGLLAMGWNIGAGIGPPLAGWIFDQTESYDLAYILGGVAMGIALMLATIVLRGYGSPER